MSYPIIFENDSDSANSCRNDRKYKNILGTWIWYTVCLYVIFSQAPPLNVKSIFAICYLMPPEQEPFAALHLFFLTIIPPKFLVHNTCGFAANYYRLAIHLQPQLSTPHFEWVGWGVSLIMDSVEQFIWLDRLIQRREPNWRGYI